MELGKISSSCCIPSLHQTPRTLFFLEQFAVYVQCAVQCRRVQFPIWYQPCWRYTADYVRTCSSFQAQLRPKAFTYARMAWPRWTTTNSALSVCPNAAGVTFICERCSLNFSRNDSGFCFWRVVECRVTKMTRQTHDYAESRSSSSSICSGCIHNSVSQKSRQVPKC